MPQEASQYLAELSELCIKAFKEEDQKAGKELISRAVVEMQRFTERALLKDDLIEALKEISIVNLAWRQFAFAINIIFMKPLVETNAYRENLLQLIRAREGEAFEQLAKVCEFLF